MSLGFIYSLPRLFPHCEVTKFSVSPPGLLLFSFIPFMLFTLTTILVLDNIIIEAEEPRVINSQ